MERKIVWMLVAILTSGNMLAQQVKYAISGSFSENGKMVYLIDKLTEKAIDSVAVADGKFTFSGTADKDALMGVMVGKKSWEIQFFNDGTPVVVNINDSTLTGSPQNERLAKYDVEGYIPMRNLHAKTARMTREEMLAKEDELMDEMKRIAFDAAESVDPKSGADIPALKTRVKNSISNYLVKTTKRNPMVIPVIVQV